MNCMTAWASSRKVSLPTAMPTRLMHSRHLARSSACVLSLAAPSTCRNKGITYRCNCRPQQQRSTAGRMRTAPSTKRSCGCMRASVLSLSAERKKAIGDQARGLASV